MIGKEAGNAQTDCYGAYRYEAVNKIQARHCIHVQHDVITTLNVFKFITAKKWSTVRQYASAQGGYYTNYLHMYYRLTNHRRINVIESTLQPMI